MKTSEANSLRSPMTLIRLSKLLSLLYQLKGLVSSYANYHETKEQKVNETTGNGKCRFYHCSISELFTLNNGSSKESHPARWFMCEL